MRVIATRGYERGAARLLTPEARMAAEAEIVARPDAWPVIAGTGGARKARIALPGRGKRGGARVIYFVLTARGTLYLLDIYAKNAKEDLTSADKQEIRRRIEAIAAEA
jgi:mRNA-degrading endonuclease RelE of RelBE toxin-antitoxin system